MRERTSKPWCFMLLGMMLSTTAVAQVTFQELSFAEAQQRAQREGKIIFVDVMRSGPLPEHNQRVEAEVFTIDSIASFFRDNCVSIRMDMGSEAGKEFIPNLNMLMYPAYVFYDAKGAQLQYTNAFAVAQDPNVLMQKARASAAVADEKMANTRSIRFEQRTDWAALLGQAKSSGKLIFLDAQTEWCRPCRMMERDVFTLDRVADFYNERFINVSMDMEKGDGPRLVKEYGITAYPTYLFIDGDGQVVHRDGGYKDAEPFIAVGEQAAKASASHQGISFVDGNWESILARAKAEDKLIFLDGYAVWCGPCKIMDKDVFTRADVGDYFNGTFINVKVDMEKGEGIMLKDRYGIKAYPTYLFINANGEEVHRIVGSSPAEKFMANAQIALQPEQQLGTLAARYANGERGQAFLRQYLDGLALAYRQDEATTVATQYLETLPESEWLSAANWQLLNRYLVDPASPVLRHYALNRDKMARLGIEKADDQLEKKFGSALHLALGPDGDASKATLKDVQRTIKRAALPNTAQLLRLGELLGAAKFGNWSRYIKVMDGVVAEGNPVYGQSVPVAVAFFGARVLRETEGRYAGAVLRWTDEMLPKLENALDKSKLYDLRQSAYRAAGDEQNAELAKATSKELVAKWQAENGGSGAMMMMPMTIK